MIPKTRLRLEFIVYNGHQILTFDTWVRVVTIDNDNFNLRTPRFTTRFSVILMRGDCSNRVMNNKSRLRLESMAYKGCHKLTLETWVMKNHKKSTKHR